MIPEHQNHRVRLKLKTRNIWSIDERVSEVIQIRAWLDELTDWQPDAYTMKYYDNNDNPVIDVWFEHEQQAVACSLRW